MEDMIDEMMIDSCSTTSILYMTLGHDTIISVRRLPNPDLGVDYCGSTFNILSTLRFMREPKGCLVSL